MNWISHLVLVVGCLGTITASRTCPRGCDCNDKLFITRCDQKAQLDYVPHILNPGLRELYLPNNNIRVINSAFEVYTNLVVLDLSYNAIQSLDINSGGRHANSKMETLLLKNNNISEIKANSFSGMVSLHKLDLSFNQIQVLNASMFQSLKSLITLDLSHNTLHTISERVFSGLVNLQYLNISSNSISHLSPTIFKSVPNLIHLNVSFTKLTKLYDDQFNSLNKLLSLDISNCEIEEFDQNAFRGLANLTVLDFQQNYLKYIPSKAFFPNNVIHSLLIGQNPYERIHAKAFYNLKNLKRLYISNCSLLTDIDRNAFLGLENLEMLELSNNAILERINRNLFDNLFALSSLILFNNNFTSLEIDLINRYKKSDLYLDVRNNPFNCNCSLEWLNFHLIRMFNKTIGHDPEYFRKINLTFHSIDSLLNNNYSDIIIEQNALDVKCASPFALENKLIIKLHKDKFGCFVLESIIPIIIGGLIGIVIVAGVVILSIIRCKYHISGFVKNQLYAENARNQLDLYQKPEFVFVPNYNDLYKRNPDDFFSVRHPLNFTPTTEL